MLFDRVRERPQGGKGNFDVRIARLDLVPVGAGNSKRQFQRIDRIEAQPIAEQGLCRVDLGRINLQFEGLDYQARDFPFLKISIHGEVRVLKSPTSHAVVQLTLIERDDQIISQYGKDSGTHHRATGDSQIHDNRGVAPEPSLCQAFTAR